MPDHQCMDSRISPTVRNSHSSARRNRSLTLKRLTWSWKIYPFEQWCGHAASLCKQVRLFLDGAVKTKILQRALPALVKIVLTASWPHYLNKNVFSDRRNRLYAKSASLRCGGKLFHSPGPAAAKALSPKVLWVRVTTHVRLSKERSRHVFSEFRRVYTCLTYLLKDCARRLVVMRKTRANVTEEVHQTESNRIPDTEFRNTLTPIIFKCYLSEVPLAKTGQNSFYIHCECNCIWLWHEFYPIQLC